MGRAATPALLGHAHLGEVRHVCAFFSSDEEGYRVLLPFIAEGFACGHKAVHVLPAGREAEHLRRLTAAGIDPAAARATGQLELRDSAETYLLDGAFDPERMLASFEAMASGNAGGDFPLSRIVCHMDWAREHSIDHRDLIAFEARVNHVWRRHDDIVICVYDLGMLSGEMVIDIMRTHPLVLIGDVLQENPFFTPPEEFLRGHRDGIPAA